MVRFVSDVWTVVLSMTHTHHMSSRALDINNRRLLLCGQPTKRDSLELSIRLRSVAGSRPPRHNASPLQRSARWAKELAERQFPYIRLKSKDNSALRFLNWRTYSNGTRGPKGFLNLLNSCSFFSIRSVFRNNAQYPCKKCRQWVRSTCPGRHCEQVSTIYKSFSNS